MTNKRVVWKYVLPGGYFRANAIGGPVRLVGEDGQGNACCVWVEGDPSSEPFQRIFHVVGTGHTFPSEYDLAHIGSVHAASGHVWHYYEEFR